MKAFIFDFDGLIVDTELAEFESWRQVYAEHGAQLTLDTWMHVIGAPPGVFDPVGHLEKLIGRRVDREAIIAERRKKGDEIVRSMPILPGVLAYLDEAKKRGFLLGVASNSRHDWVDGHLKRLGLYERFDCIRCSDDVEHPKPAPDLYQAVLNRFGIGPDEAIAFEDSLPGVRAARTAGLFCVAIPSALTRGLDFREASLRVDSLAELPVDDLLARAQAVRPS